jgi:translocation and assembly module TamA
MTPVPRPRLRRLLCSAGLLCPLVVLPVLAQSPSPPAAAEASGPEVVDDDAPRRFAGVEWRGVEGELLDNLRYKVSLARLKTGTGLRPARFAHFLRVLPREVDEALAPFGYYRAAVEIEPLRGGGTLGARVQVTLGEPVTVTALSLRIDGPGGGDRRLQQALAGFAPGKGSTLRHDVYEASKADIARRLADRGYFEARSSAAQVRVNRAAGSAEIELHWDSGPRYRFGEVVLHNNPFRPGVLPPLVPFAPGDEFQQWRLLELQRRYTDLDYFRRIDVQPRLPEAPLDEAEAAAGTPSATAAVPTAAAPGSADAAPPQVPVDVQLELAPRNVYRTGASYGTDNGLAIKLGYTRRWLNDRGHKLDSDLLLGEQRSLGTVRYRIPAFERYTGWWTGSLALRDERFGGIRSDIAELSLLRDARLRNNLYTAGVFVQREQYRGFGETLVYPQLSMERSVADDPLYPTRGFRWKVLGRVGNGAFGSEVDFAQIIASATAVTALGANNRLILRAEAGSTVTDEFERMPPSLRFYAGGDRSVRGYGYQELGPLFEGDQRVGGKRLLVGSVEFERMFTPTWGGAVFVDGGNAFGSRFEAARGVGLGVRWRSPVGPIRVDIGRGLDDPEQGIRLHIQLGPEL